jgi:hypothetical protein
MDTRSEACSEAATSSSRTTSPIRRADGRGTDDDDVLLDYADGGYRILMKAPGRPDARLNLGTPDEPRSVEAVSVEADVTERAGPYSGGQLDEYELHGVACWGAEGDSDRLGFGYKFVLTPEGHYGILKDDDGLVILTEGDSDFVRYGATNRIRGDCTSGGGRPTLLVLYVDGKKIAQARDPDGADRFPAIGLTAGTSDVGTDILFDNVLVRNPLARPLSPSGPFRATETGRNPVQLGRPVRSSPNLCKTKGIRYSGRTAQGGAVCFRSRRTTRDSSRWASHSCPPIGARRWRPERSTPEGKPVRR